LWKIDIRDKYIQREREREKERERENMFVMID
jgi:hypothetical protein